jgi:hypothetical protein
MLSHELLINKGFELNQYTEGNFYELTEVNEVRVANILDSCKLEYDPEWIDEKVILQLKEDFTNILICIDCNTWDLSEQELEKILEVL